MTASDIAIAVYTLKPLPTFVSTPTFSPAAGTCCKHQNTTISTATSDADIYYTTNGNNTTNSTESSSSLYTTQIPISSTTTLKAKAYKTGLNASDIATATYTIYTPTMSITVSPSSVSQFMELADIHSITKRPKRRFYFSSHNLVKQQYYGRYENTASGVFSALAKRNC